MPGSWDVGSNTEVERVTRFWDFGRLRGPFLALLLIAIMVAPCYAQWPISPDMGKSTKEKDDRVSVTGSGRFQVFVSPSVKGETFMLDTETGKVWILKKNHSTGDFFFEKLRVEGVDKSSADGKNTKKAD